MSIWLKQAPSIALGNAKKELLHLGNYASKAFDLSYNYIIDLNEKVAEKGHKTEEAINTIDEKLTRYLITLQVRPLARKKVKCWPTSLIHPVIWNELGTTQKR